ncbi:hypothetical protein L873DRAFT_1787722 [Choiromyces venosus 120613-1]|uniref:F-box domain-containing protein n=1 Tax=Choiromyces venosus 120613-1 TaxID=1336337 RepID=A0A3N4JZJ0_9PEZI|nr:hypothetical protein L873DRAFT_1787722 [Choiromyces venosus 120613-1]
MGAVDPFKVLNIFELAMIVEYLPPVDVVRLRRVSSEWDRVLSSDYICKVALQANFPHAKETKELYQRNALASKSSNLQENLDEEVPQTGKKSGKAGKKNGKTRNRKSLELQSILASNQYQKNARSELSEVSLGFSRATYRLHTRALAKPTKVHKYRLHHICDRGFASTAHYLFWCESNRKIWQQKIGEGISGRRGLKLGSVGNRIAHVHQITAVENVPGRDGSGLVVLLFREVLTWGLEMAALDYETDEVVWKLSLNDNPNSLQRTKGWVHYLTQVQVSVPAVGGGATTQEYRYTLVVHCLLTGKVLTRTTLHESWPRQKRSGYPNNLPEVPGAYTVFPGFNAEDSSPQKLVVAFEDKGSRIPGEEVSKKAAYKVLIYSLGRKVGEESSLLKEIDLERSGIEIGAVQLEKAIRMEFSAQPKSHKGPPNLMIIESKSHPHIIPSKTRSSLEELEYPTLSVWTLETVNFDILEIRRYQSRYGEDEIRPSIERRAGTQFVPVAEHTRMEALNVDSGVSWVIFDQSKKQGPDPSDISDDDSEDERRIVSRPTVRIWQPPGVHPPASSSRIDTVGYEEVAGGVSDGVCWKGEGEDQDLEGEESPFGHQMSMTPEGCRKRKRSHSVAMERSGSVVSNSSGFSSGASSTTTTASTIYPSPPFTSNSISSDSTTHPKERWFKQVSRHKLQQPDIMRRRRRQKLGEEEEDWGMMPVRSNPAIYLGGNSKGDAMDGLDVDGDERYLVVLTRIKGWSSMVVCLDFEPEW